MYPVAPHHGFVPSTAGEQPTQSPPSMTQMEDAVACPRIPLLIREGLFSQPETFSSLVARAPLDNWDSHVRRILAPVSTGRQACEVTLSMPEES